MQDIEEENDDDEVEEAVGLGGDGAGVVGMTLTQTLISMDQEGRSGGLSRASSSPTSTGEKWRGTQLRAEMARIYCMCSNPILLCNSLRSSLSLSLSLYY